VKIPVKKIVAITDKSLAPLMRILGIDLVYEVESPEDVADVVKRIRGDESIGIVIVQQKFIKYVAVEEAARYPIFVALPDSLEQLKVHPLKLYEDAIRKYIGYEIHLSQR